MNNAVAIKVGDLVEILQPSSGVSDGYAGVHEVTEVCRDGDVAVHIGRREVYFTRQRVGRVHANR